MKKEAIIETFIDFCKVYEDKKGGPKLDIMSQYLTELEVPFEWVSGIGIIVNKQENPKKVIISHMDLIKKFQKGFKDNVICNIKKETIIGALDNTITNSVLFLVIKQLKELNLLNDIEFLFSEGEEVGFHGVRNYFKTNKDRVKNAFFINLDVTNEGYKTSASIEYDACNFKLLKEIQKIEAEKDYKFFYTSDRVCDDMDEVISQGSHGLSYCLPTKGLIHSYKNKARIESLEPYAEGLLTLITDISNEDCVSLENDIKSYQFDSALKVADKSEIKVTRTQTSWNFGSSNSDPWDLSHSNHDLWESSKDFFEEDELDLTSPTKVIKTIEKIVKKDFNYLSTNKAFLELISYSARLDFFNPRFFAIIIGEKESKEFLEKLASKDILIYISSKDIFMIQTSKENNYISEMVELSQLNTIEEENNLKNILTFLRQLNLLYIHKSELSIGLYIYNKFTESWIKEAIELTYLKVENGNLVIDE